ncbi:MAG: hypothetical protein ABI601_05525 [bacterium]
MQAERVLSQEGRFGCTATAQLSDSAGSYDVVLAPFTIQGNLVGFDGPDDIADKPELFNVPFHGNGIAVVELDFDLSSAGDRLYHFRSVSYDITRFHLP